MKYRVYGIITYCIEISVDTLVEAENELQALDITIESAKPNIPELVFDWGDDTLMAEKVHESDNS